MNSLFTQKIIAVVWDFDKTLIPGYMQRPLFEHFAVDESRFWKEVNQLEGKYREMGCEQVSSEMTYLNHVLDYTRRGLFKGLDNELLESFGGKLDFYPGLPNFFNELKQEVLNNERYQHHEITLEHYVVSTGFTRSIKGSVIAKYLDGIWGCEFVEADQGGTGRVIDQIAYVLDNTTKTRAVFEINKGVNKDARIDVNASINQEDRRIPFQNMVYIADGPSDVPVFSVVKNNGGRTYGVYNAGHKEEFQQVKNLQRDNRIDGMGPAEYTSDSSTSMWLKDEVCRIADRITEDREALLGSKVGSAPKHLND